MGKPFIVHVSADYPDANGPNRTPVIQRLVKLVASSFDQQVYSLTRLSPPLASWPRPSPQVRFEVEGEGHCRLTYAAPPRGLHHRRLLDALGEALAEHIGRGRRPDLIIGHKLTVEGVAVARAAGLLGVPYALSIQGNTDAKILAARPDLRGLSRGYFTMRRRSFPLPPGRWTGSRICSERGWALPNCCLA
ncbi:hypothetical protein OKA06_01610 [Novosphingobium sp. MW5]|nr:hypothetical protein [Novosphingobium sp. MW5]